MLQFGERFETKMKGNIFHFWATKVIFPYFQEIFHHHYNILVYYKLLYDVSLVAKQQCNVLQHSEPLL